MKKRNRKPEATNRVHVSPARWTAFRVLQDFRKGERFIDQILYSWTDRAELSVEDRGLAHQLVYGVFRHRVRLDYWIDRMSSKGIQSLPDPIVDTLRLGLFQLGFLQRVPPHAVVDESVRICEAVSMGSIKGLVNAILRRFPGRREELDTSIQGDPQGISIETSHPQWIVEWATGLFGENRALEWLENNNRPAPIFLFPVVSRIPADSSLSFQDREDKAIHRLLESIGEGNATRVGEAVQWEGRLSVSELAVLREGRAYVQDLSARNAVRFLDPRPGETIFDLCSAPGGKTLRIADLLQGNGRVVSVDSNPRRMKQLVENLSRVGFDWVETARRDLTQPWVSAEGSADGVLLDVPCSGLGTIRRKVDLKYRLRPEDIKDLADKGLRLLETAERLVKPGGRLVFSTCTLTTEENEGTVNRFLEKHSDSWRLDRDRTLPSWLSPVGEATPELESDGSYSALLLKSQ